MMQAAENGEYTNGVFSDLARGIDTNNHDIFTKKKIDWSTIEQEALS